MKISTTERILDDQDLRQGKKWKLYSGLFILLKEKLDLPRAHRRKILRPMLPVFAGLVQHPVHTLV